MIRKWKYKPPATLTPRISGPRPTYSIMVDNTGYTVSDISGRYTQYHPGGKPPSPSHSYFLQPHNVRIGDAIVSLAPDGILDSCEEQLNNVELRRITYEGNGSLQKDGKHDNGEEENDEEQGAFAKMMTGMSTSTSGFMTRHRKLIRYIALAILNLAVFGYFFWALDYWYTRDRSREWQFCDGFGMLLILYTIVYFFMLYFLLVKQFFGKAISRTILKPIYKIYTIIWKFWFVRIGLYVIVVVALVLFLVFDTEGTRERLISLLGFFVLLLLGFIFSAKPTRIVWRPVMWGIFLQFVFGLLTIRWTTGREIFVCIGDKVSAFLKYADEGSKFVFSDFLVNDIGVFAFRVLPVIFFFSLMIEVMFYFGGMQWICLKLGWWLQISMGTTVCESVICAANTFLGMSESPLLIKPYFADLTKSEIHAIMASGFATVSGSTLAAYISFGVQPAHLITASVMSAPAALCYSKLFFPETDKSRTAVSTIKTVTSEHSSVLDAAATGAGNAIPLVLGIASNLVAFVAVVAFLNGILGWLGWLVGFDFISFEWIFGKVFIPLSWIMGVPWEECEIVGSLIGLKTVVNEFVAYQRMGEYKKQGLLSSRGEAIATYALCGFTNPSSVGILVGALSAMAPSRKKDITSVAGRAFVSGCAVCFMTACVAGLLIQPGAFAGSPPGNSTLFL